MKPTATPSNAKPVAKAVAKKKLPLNYPFPLGTLGALPSLIKWSQENRPVCPVRMPSGDQVWMLTRRDDIAEVFADSRFSRNLSALAPRMAGENLTTIERGIFSLDPPDHTRVKSVLSGHFTRRAVARHVPVIEAIANRLVEAMATGPNPADLIESYAWPLHLQVVQRLWGIPAELHAEHERVFSTMASMTSGPDEITAETQAIRRLSLEVIAIRRASAVTDGHDGADDPISALLAAREQGVISEDELIGTVFLLLFTGSDATISPIAAGAMMLSLHPHQVRDCLADPALWPKAAEEVLRFFHNGVLGFPFIAREDVEVSGVTIRAGEAVCASMQAATWDTKYVWRPERFDIHRPETAEATFGAGPHYCLGSRLARVLLATALCRLFTRLPDLAVAVDPDDIPWRNDVLFVRPAVVPVTW